MNFEMLGCDLNKNIENSFINEFNNESKINESKINESLNQNNSINILNESNDNNDYNDEFINDQKKDLSINSNIDELNSNIIINEENKDYYINEVIKYQKIILNISNLDLDIKDNKSRVDINIQFLSSEEVEKNINNTSEVVLINDENMNKFKSLLNYEIIHKYNELKGKQEKKNYLAKYIIEFYNFVLFYKNKNSISKNISLIENYKDCLNNIEKENKFYIIYKANKITKLLKKKKVIKNIYYFTYKNNSYIYFSGEKKIFQLKYEKNYEKNFCKLIEYDNNKKDIDLVKIILDNTKKNKNRYNMEKYLNLEYKDFKKFCLINENWLNSKIPKNNTEFKVTIFKPEIKKTGFQYQYPINFNFMENNIEELVNQLKNVDKNVCDNDVYLTEMFFVYGKNTSNKNLYLGILEDNVIYFYLFETEKYKIQFLIEFNNDDFLFNEINEKIIFKGIENYLFEMGININKKGKQNLINYDLEKVGIFLNLNDNRKYFKPTDHSKNLEMIIGSDIYNSVIKSLVNIRDLKEIFLNRTKLYNKKIIQKNEGVTYIFYKLIQFMWSESSNNLDDNNTEKNEESQNSILLIELKTKFENISPLQNTKLLIESILLSIHYEQQKDNFNKNILNYDISKLRENMHKINTFISDIFFFKLKLKCCKNRCSTNCMLFFDMDKEYKLSKEHSVDIETILSQANIQLECDYCKNTVISQIKFITFPKILIIGFKPKSNNNIIFEYTEQIDLKNKKNNFKYEIISLIIKKNETFVTYIKSSTEANIWYEYIDDMK